MTLLFVDFRNSPGAFRASGERRAYPPPINFLPVFLLLALLALAWQLVFGYEDEALRIEDIERMLTPEELTAYRAAQQEVDNKFGRCIQYILYAQEDGLYECAACPPGIPFVTLKKGDIWYIGYTCQDDAARHSHSFRKKRGVWLFINYIGSVEECRKIELKLLRGYRFLPESIKPEIKLILPPNNRTDKN